MRLIDVDELMESIRKALGIKSMTKSLLLPAERTIIDLIDSAPTVGGWEGADKRPPEKGWYLVWKVCHFTPDHYGDPDGYWKMDILHWDEKYGWSFEKVKYWMPLPEPPGEG